MENSEKIINNYAWLVKKVATKFYGANMEDLYQAGFIGLLKAYKNYEANPISKFSTYAYDYIWGEMYQVVLNLKAIKVNKDTLKLYKQIEKAKETLTQVYEKEPSIRELSLFLEIPEDIIGDTINSAITILSLDAPVNDTETKLYEVLGNPIEDNIDDKIVLNDMINGLPSPEKEIMISRYYNDMTQSETANSLGITQVMVSRLEKKTISKMRSSML